MVLFEPLFWNLKTDTKNKQTSEAERKSMRKCPKHASQTTGSPVACCHGDLKLPK